MDFCDRELANGLRVVALRQGTGPLVEVRLHVPAPALTARRVAVQAMLATLLSGRRTVRRATSATPAGAAADFAAWSDYRRIGMACGCAAGGLDTALGLVAEAVSGLDVTAADFAADRDRLVTRLRLGLADPDVQVRLALLRRLFGAHPIALQVPDLDELSTVELGEVDQLRDEALRPQGVTLVIVGSGDPARSVGAAAALLGDWQPGGQRAVLPPAPPIAGGPLEPLRRPGAARSQIRLRAAGIPHIDRRYPALLLATSVFGAHMSSRLVQRLREELGYVYGVSCYLEPVPGGTMIALEADTAAATTSPSIDVLADEFDRLRTSPPTLQEFDGARRHALGSAAISLAPRGAMASALAELAAHNVDPSWLSALPEALRAVTHDDVISAAARFLRPERFTGLVAGDLATTTPLALAARPTNATTGA